MMYICKKIECQAIWQIMSQRMNTNMKTNTKTDQILRPSDSLQTIEKKHGRESKTCPYDFMKETPDGRFVIDNSPGRGPGNWVTIRNGSQPRYNSQYPGSRDLKPGTANFEYKHTFF